MEKLAVMEKTSDGFVIAEEDLRLRGPGDVLGTMQSGLGDLRFADFLADTALLREARALADQVITADPELTHSHAALRSLIHDAAPAANQRG
jgi:ATP-dependent DNA helicase RecG